MSPVVNESKLKYFKFKIPNNNLQQDSSFYNLDTGSFFYNL